MKIYSLMSKKISFTFLLHLFFISTTFGQILNPVSWTFDAKKTGDNEFELIFQAKIDKGWHLYSQHLPSEDGPIATSSQFSDEKKFQRIGKVKEPKPHKEYDPNFDMELSYFENSAAFTQKIKIQKDVSISGEIEFMVCDASKCLPPELVPFSFDLKAEESIKEFTQTVDKKEETELLNPILWNFEVVEKDSGKVELQFKAQLEEGWHLYSQHLSSDEGPVATSFSFTENSAARRIDEVKESNNVVTKFDKTFNMQLNYFENSAVFSQVLEVFTDTVVTGELTYMVCDDEKCLPPETIPFSFEVKTSETSLINTENTAESKSSSFGFLGIFIAGFLGGLLALLTPCVFPMIPMTVSFFTKQSKNKAQGIRNALLYAFSIIFIYVLMGFGITLLFGADALNALSTNVWFNLAFFILLVVFAISFFGAFEITLPSSWINKADAASDKGGIIGIFFMAFTLSLVSFSCTGPIIGTLLVEAAVNGGVIGPITGMTGFSLALALPFGLFAAFPGWLNSLPKSGGWLNSVKVSLGFLELALAFKFLSNADLVVQAGLLKRELFIAIWVGIFLLLTLYLLGIFKLSHDSELKNLSVTRLLFAVLSLVFTIYLIPGMWGAPLKLISGFPPPMFYSESPNGIGGIGVSATMNSGTAIPKGADPKHCPHNLNCFHDYDEGLAYAKKVNKPVMLDFTGWACVNCRKMEEQVWSDPRVLERLNKDVVLISLYVDEKTELPKEEQIEVEIGGKKKKIKTIGNKWSYFQASRYATNSQPYYVIIDLKENQLIESAAYNPDIEKFIDWLDRGKQAFEKGN